MRYEMTPRGMQLFAPDDPLESQLVFDTIASRATLIPYILERDHDHYDDYRQGAWYAWPLHLQDLTFEDIEQAFPNLASITPEDRAPFVICPTIMVDLALPITYREQGLECRWSEILDSDLSMTCFSAVVRAVLRPDDVSVEDVESENILACLPPLQAALRRRKLKYERRDV